jgi:hypothetical protein
MCMLILILAPSPPLTLVLSCPPLLLFSATPLHPSMSCVLVSGGLGLRHQTPAFNPNLPYTPAVAGHQSIMGGAPSTCLRLPRRGESILSSRGSPVVSPLPPFARPAPQTAASSPRYLCAELAFRPDTQTRCRATSCILLFALLSGAKTLRCTHATASKERKPA